MTFRQMRRLEKQLSLAESIQLLQQADFGTLACQGEAGYPYSVPLNFVYANDVIYFHSAQAGAKLDFITANSKVCFSAVSYYRLLAEKFDTEYDSVIVFGEAAVVTDEQEKRQALMLLAEKYSAGFREQAEAYIARALAQVAVIRIRIQHMTGKRGR